jgi:LuxR family maltose regulon positive regulatory protein
LVNRDVLLEVKTHPPGLRAGLVARPRLLQTLEEGRTGGRILTLISAPAGFGKTTLLADWARHTACPVSWLSLEESENDPALFLRYLVESIRPSAGTISSLPPPLPQSPQSAHPASVMPSLVNELARAEPFLLILDDYHLVTSPGVHELVAFLLEHIPASLHIAVGTREDPPLPLARLRAGGLITELREADLRFSTAETEEFIVRSADLSLSAQAIEALEARTEGWVAGLQLAAFALQKEGGRPEKFLAAFSGDHRYVMDYLVVEVLERLPPPTRDFLRRTAILDRLCASLCDAVIEGGGSQAVLEQLEASNIFLFPLDSRREWYRYHRLFAEFLTARLPPADESGLHLRAAAWYATHNLPFRAVRHALQAGKLTGDYSEATRLIRTAADDIIREGRAQTLLDWMDSLPQDLSAADPELSLYKGWAFTLNGELPEAIEAVNGAERALEGGVDPPLRGMISLLRAFHALMGSGEYSETIRLARLAIDNLRGRKEQWLPMAYWLLAEPYERMGDLDQAIRTLQEARTAWTSPLSHLFTDLVDMMLVYDLNLTGRRRKALSVCRETIRRRTAMEEEASPTSCLLLARQAMLYYESNELKEARRLYEEAVAYGTRHRQEPFVTFARGINAPLLEALGRMDEALEALDRSADFARQTGLTDLGTVLAMRANLHLRLGRMDSVRRWVEEAGCTTEEEPQYIRLDTHLVYARWLLARKAHDEAGRFLARLRAYLERCGIRRPLISVRVLSALLAERTGDRPSAAGHMTAAVQLAAPEEYVRIFLEEDPQTLDLLPAARKAAPSFVEKVSAVGRRMEPAPGGSTAGGARGKPSGLPEPLSNRELEVLRLVAKGLTNAQIAERLVIALPTAKRHIQNIYGKLGVNSRTQAVAEGRRTGLIE